MEEKSSFKESAVYYSVRSFGIFVRRVLPLAVALWVGKLIGLLAYYFDYKHKSQAYANLKMAFAHDKAPEEIKRITKKLFQNYGQNLIELFRLPLLNPQRFEEVIKVEGRENVTESLKQGKGVILLAMHFGSWEIASVSCALLGFPYKVMVKPQERYTQLDNLLNGFRTCGGSVVLSRGLGTRDFIKSLENNEVIGMVVDQGGKDGVLVPLFGREASMSSGAIRMGLKKGVPICFSIIIREKGSQHRMIIHKPLELENTGDLEKDVVMNLKKITAIMEDYIKKYPSEYMWFYKIWKYSKESQILILDDGRTGHLRQSQTTAKITQDLLAERSIHAKIQTVPVSFSNSLTAKIFPVLSFLTPPYLCQGRLEILRWVLNKESFRELMTLKADFIISTGARMAGVNYLLSRDHNAKSVVILKPGLFGFRRFDLVILPQHDVEDPKKVRKNVTITKAAPNLVDADYLKDQSEKLLNRYSHLKSKVRFKIGLLIGGNAKHLVLSEKQIRVLIHQIKEVARGLNADILVSSSRRTPANIENILQQEFKKYPGCPLLIIANQNDVPEAVGGILGLSDLVLVSGDSISMVSEAASSGKYTVVFSPQKRDVLLKSTNKHIDFIEKLSDQGFILSSHVNDISEAILSLAKNKIQTKRIDDNQIIREALRYII